jgi:hypothetical protein
MKRADLERLFAEVQKQLPNSPGIIVTASSGDTKTTSFARDFLRRSDLPLRPTELVIAATQNDGGAQKLVNITLGEKSNQLRVQWADSQWVLGASEVLTRFFRQRSNVLLGFYGRHFGSLNAIAFLALLILLPDLSLVQRIAYTVALFAVLISHMLIVRWLARTIIYLEPEPVVSLGTAWSTGLAILTSAIGGLLAFVLYDLVRSWGWLSFLPAGQG